MTTTNTMPAQVIAPATTLEERVAQLEKQIADLLAKPTKTRSTTAKVLSEDELEARRLKVNEASRISKEKQRAKSKGFATVEEYREYPKNKKNAVVVTPEEAAQITEAAQEDTGSDTAPAITLGGPIVSVTEDENTDAAQETVEVQANIEPYKSTSSKKEKRKK